MYLPYDDSLKIEYLSRVFDRNRISNCYKYFWFLAILEKIGTDKTDFTYDELITEMVADAWYMVNEFKLRLGPVNTTDNLEEAAKYLFTVLYDKKIPTTIAKEKLLDKLKNETDKTYWEYKAKLIVNVPYCLQSPFYPEIKSPGKDKIDAINRAERLLYVFSRFSSLSTSIHINDEWVPYLVKNNEILKDWTRYNLIGYLQDRNPNVPGISDKIIPPCARKLEHAKTYWKTVISADATLCDIYADMPLSDISISIDHFVPWQYVSHDELWNLSPTTKSINSKKSNYLPPWEAYFDKLCNLEYRANELRFQNERVQKAFHDCKDHHVNSSDVYASLYSEQLDFTDFRTRLSNVLFPVYQAAVNCGFREWSGSITE